MIFFMGSVCYSLPRETCACWCATVFLSKAHRAASWRMCLGCSSRRGLFSSDLEPPLRLLSEWGSGNIYPRFIQHKLVSNPQHTSTDFADFWIVRIRCGRRPPSSNAVIPRKYMNETTSATCTMRTSASVPVRANIGPPPKLRSFFRTGGRHE